MALMVREGVEGAPLVINVWVLICIMAAAVLAAICRLIRRGSLVSLRGSPILTLWRATQFIVAPIFVLIGPAWLVYGIGFEPALPVLSVLLLALIYGSPLVFVV